MGKGGTGQHCGTPALQGARWQSSTGMGKVSASDASYAGQACCAALCRAMPRHAVPAMLHNAAWPPLVLAAARQHRRWLSPARRQCEQLLAGPGGWVLARPTLRMMSCRVLLPPPACSTVTSTVGLHALHCMRACETCFYRHYLAQKASQVAAAQSGFDRTPVCAQLGAAAHVRDQHTLAHRALFAAPMVQGQSGAGKASRSLRGSPILGEQHAVLAPAKGRPCL